MAAIPTSQLFQVARKAPLSPLLSNWRAAVALASGLGLALTVGVALRPTAAPAVSRGQVAGLSVQAPPSLPVEPAPAPLTGTTAGSPAPAVSVAPPVSVAPSPSLAASMAPGVESPSSTLAAPAPSNPITVYRVQNSGPNGLNVRAGANVSQRKLGVLHDGALVTMTGQPSAGWVQVAGEGFAGWVSTQYLGPGQQVDKPALAKLSQS